MKNEYFLLSPGIMTSSRIPIAPPRPGAPSRVIQGYFPGGKPRIIQASSAAEASARPPAPAPIQARPATGVLQPSLSTGQSPRPILRANGLHRGTVQAASPARPPTPQPILPKSTTTSAVQPHADDAFGLPANFKLKPHGSGQPLPEPIQKKMEAFFNTSFADVRVHVGNEAPSIGALAFTHGTDLYFAPGQYNPQSTQGQQLLGHELTHVVQQRAGRVRNPLGAGIAVVQDPGLEAEAERMGVSAAAQPAGHPSQVQPKFALAGVPPPFAPARTQTPFLAFSPVRTRVFQPMKKAPKLSESLKKAIAELRQNGVTLPRGSDEWEAPQWVAYLKKRQQQQSAPVVTHSGPMVEYKKQVEPTATYAPQKDSYFPHSSAQLPAGIELGFSSTPVVSTTVNITPPDPYGNLTGEARDLARRLEEDRQHYQAGANPGNNRFKGTTMSDTVQGLQLYNYANNRTYSRLVLDQVGLWWASRSAAYAYNPPVPKPYNDSHDVANYLFHHPQNRAYNGHANQTGGKTT
jgi:Domain of unknown function (DUF4157)